ncbi:hypothetical protein F5880DRAFT_1511200 [Lentinula raphanica]|nr:hypothetical protein F5880DRAFT_1511200 [Lentinula raphanica]
MLPEEIEFLWTDNLLRPFNILYIVQRYMPFIDTIGILFIVSFAVEKSIDTQTCQILYNISGCLTEVILTMRTWVLWGKGSKLLIILSTFFLCCSIPVFYMFNNYLQKQTYEPSPLPSKIGCIILGGQPTLFICWLILLAYEADQSGRWIANSMSRTIYGEGITYYIITFLWSIINIAVILLLPVRNVLN